MQYFMGNNQKQHYKSKYQTTENSDMISVKEAILAIDPINV
jgi:hypothetical protein